MRHVHLLIGTVALMFLGGNAFAQTPEDPAGTPPNSFDQQFAMKAAVAGMAEVKLSEIALQRGTDAIRPIAERMRADHAAANQRLMMLAPTKMISLPVDVPAEQQQVIDRLSKLSGQDFDRAYLETLMTSHDTSLQLFVDELKQGADLDLLAFAASTTPVIIQHYALLLDAPYLHAEH